MKTENTFYLKCDNCLLSKNHLITILTTAIGLTLLSFVLKHYQAITASNAYLISAVCTLFAALSLYQLSKTSSGQYIFMDNEEILFKQSKSADEIRLRFDGLDNFETRFSEIILSTKAQEKIILPLHEVANKQKRWEIKEFLRQRIKQIKANAVAA